MQLPIFVSQPALLNEGQIEARELVMEYLEEVFLEPRSPAHINCALAYSMRDAMQLARRCAGGIILGFNQVTVTSGISNPGTVGELEFKESMSIPTAWNHLEAGILLGLGLPLLVLREPGITGGTFDLDTADAVVVGMPDRTDSCARRSELREIFARWQSEVHYRYYPL